MAPPLLIPDPENATIEELKQVSPVGYNETATRCTAIQMLLAGVSRELVRDVFAALLARSQPHRAHLANDQSTRVQQLCL